MWVGGGGWFRGGIIWWGGRQPSDPPTSTTRKQDHTYLGEVAGDRLGLYTVAQVTVFGWWGGGGSRGVSPCVVPPSGPLCLPGCASLTWQWPRISCPPWPPRPHHCTRGSTVRCVCMGCADEWRTLCPCPCPPRTPRGRQKNVEEECPPKLAKGLCTYHTKDGPPLLTQALSAGSPPAWACWGTRKELCEMVVGGVCVGWGGGEGHG